MFPVVYQTVNSALKRACASTGIPPVSCHDFRHTFISNLIRKNVPLSVIERVTGDTQTTILRRYSHIFGNDEVMILDALRDIQKAVHAFACPAAACCPYLCGQTE